MSSTGRSPRALAAVAIARAVWHCGAMKMRDTRAGGCLLTLAILGGAAIGIAVGAPLAGAVVGTLVGAVLAIVLWLVNRR